MSIFDLRLSDADVDRIARRIVQILNPAAAELERRRIALEDAYETVPYGGGLYGLKGPHSERRAEAERNATAVRAANYAVGEANAIAAAGGGEWRR